MVGVRIAYSKPFKIYRFALALSRQKIGKTGSGR
jgi:hypothetical protein